LSRTLLIQADAAAIPLKNASVDIVFSRGSIFFWTEIERCFAEIRRIMKPGALAFIGGGYGLSTPEAVVEPILKRKKSGAGKKSIPRLDLDKLILIARKSFENATIQQAPRRGFWLKCNN
jgi:ubiquinone/menaquinone biosynthesis C-methylase UbiE